MLSGRGTKVRIGAAIEEVYGVQALDNEFYPDFLLHSRERGNFEHQELIVEVKSGPNLRFEEVKSDLAKIQQFISRYHFRQGLFLAVNISTTKLCELLSRSESVRWIQESIPDAACILIMCKERQDTPLFEGRLNEVASTVITKRYSKGMPNIASEEGNV